MWKSLFNKVAGLEACDFIKKRPQGRCFPVNIAKCLRIPDLKNIYKGGCFCLCFLFIPLEISKSWNSFTVSSWGIKRGHGLEMG